MDFNKFAWTAFKYTNTVYPCSYVGSEGSWREVRGVEFCLSQRLHLSISGKYYTGFPRKCSLSPTGERLTTIPLILALVQIPTGRFTGQHHQK